MKAAPFEYRLPGTLDEAVAALAGAGDDAKVLAGGQSLIPMLALRLARPAVLVDINRLPGLDGIRETAGILEVGALVRQRGLERWAAARSPLFAEALRAVAHPPIRNRGTVVGSVVHADPASELPALLLCLDGAVVARGPRGERVIGADGFYRAPLTTALAADEVATAVRFTLPGAGAGWGFAEVSRRHGDFALVGAVAVLARAAAGTVSRVRLAFETSLARSPDDRELAAGCDLVGERQSDRQRRDARLAVEAAYQAALADYCQVLFGLNEFLYID